MNSELALEEAVKCLLDALTFYGNPNNYWSEPVSLEEDYCLRTLSAKLDSEKKNLILNDWGRRSRESMENFQRILNTIEKSSQKKHENHSS